MVKNVILQETVFLKCLNLLTKPQLKCELCHYTNHSTDDCYRILYCMICKREDHRHVREPIWYMDSGYSRSNTGVKSYLHKYVEQPGPKVVFGDNSSCITEGYGSIKCGVIAPNKPEIPHTKDDEVPPGQINTKGTQEQNVQNDQMITQPINVLSGNNTEDRWSRDQHIELIIIIGDSGEGMLTRSMAAKLTTTSASECLFANFLSKIEPKKEEGIDYDETFALVARMEAIRIFLVFATYMNFKFYQMDVKSAFLNGNLKEEVYVKQPPGFESSEFPDYAYTRNLLKKYEISSSSAVKTPMVLPNNLGPDLAGKSINKTLYRGMIGSLMYLTATRPDIQFSTFLCAIYQSNPKESHLIAVKRILRYLKGTPTLGLYYPKCSSFDLKGYLDSEYAGCNMDRKSTSGACQILGGKLVCWSAKKQQSVAEYVAAGCYASILWMKS
ncbi:retrovirus-related pol polyprotein from transposon TNT 1-94 [Tanacetum coccineum]